MWGGDSISCQFGSSHFLNRGHSTLGVNKAQSKSIDEYKGKIKEARKLIEDLKKKVREADSKVLANERIINDLRMQIPNTVDRAMAMTSVTGGSGLPSALTTGMSTI